ncbi:MAG: hypothetical protein D6741_15235 [Planctomycetota bacterium]|nr:MAG: hypothetical protein D6741_15235 [Planctomycetota bacterium]
MNGDRLGRRAIEECFAGRKGSFETRVGSSARRLAHRGAPLSVDRGEDRLDGSDAVSRDGNASFCSRPSR